MYAEGNRDIDLSVITERERVILTWSWLVKKSFCFHAVPFLLLPQREASRLKHKTAKVMLT